MPNQSHDHQATPAIRKAWEDLIPLASKGILSTRQMTRQQRERLKRAGILDPIMRGWYHLKSPGDQTSAQPSILDFLPIYLEERLGNRWCLSAESSLVVHLDPQTIPRRMVVMAEFCSTTVHTFDNGLRLTIYQDDQHLPTRTDQVGGFRVMPLETALGRMTNSQWNRQLHLIDKALPSMTGWESIVWKWLSEERYLGAIRLGLRLQKLGLVQSAAVVDKCLKSAGLALPSTPEYIPPKTLPKTLENIWDCWTEQLKTKDQSPAKPQPGLLQRLSIIEHAIADDALNHLALSGHVTPREAVMGILAENEIAADSAGWPLLDPHERLSHPGQETPLPGEVDPQAIVALQGYLEATRLVKRSIVRMMEGQDLEKVLRQDVRGWRLALMGPSAEAGLITRRQVLRYRNLSETETAQWEIRPTMENWVQLVAQCAPTPGRGLLAFLGILHIQPWDVGNQRMAFLILNGLNAAAGFPWTVVGAEQKAVFNSALQAALEEGDPIPLNNLLAKNRIQ